MSQLKKAQKQFDVVIVGAGISGLLLASKAKSLGKSVALIEAQDAFGGFHHPNSYSNSECAFDNSLHFIPSTLENQRLIEQVNNKFDLSLNAIITESRPLTFENGQLRDFTGFGKLTPDFFDELTSFLVPEELKFEYPWHELVKALAARLGDSLFLHHLASELVVEEKSAVGVMVNGSHFWKASEVIFAGGITELQAFLPQSLISTRLKNHLKKPKLWTLIAVDFIHGSQISDSQDLHILNGTTQDEMGPCLGRFLTAFKGKQISQWLSFAPDEDADEIENIGAIIKKMKRQIKRAYPVAFDGATQEKIIVIPSGAGYFEDSQIPSGVRFKDLSHFYLASSHLSPQKGVLKPLDQACRVLEELNWEAHQSPRTVAEKGQEISL